MARGPLGLGLQLAFALLILRTPLGEAAFSAVDEVVIALLGWVGDVTHLTGLFRDWGWLAGGQRLTLEAMIGGTLAGFMTATVAGMLL